MRGKSKQQTTPSQHNTQLQTSIIMVNLGTPEKPTYLATMRFLREFLSDRRVINITKLIWYPILYGFILPFRSQSAKNKYKKIHTADGMPLMVLSKKLYVGIKKNIETNNPNTKVYLAMRYGQRSIEKTLESIQPLPHQKIIILPMFPQYSATTTASIFDEVARCLKKWNFLPHYHFIRDYCNHESYIKALANSIRTHWKSHKKAEKILFSYHGLPEQNLANGDPYSCYCHKTTRLVAQELALGAGEYETVFQSRFGPSQWLKPYTEETIISLAKSGTKNLDMIAPSFAVDCLETIDEISREYQEIFQENGGSHIQYIPALNDSSEAINLMTSIIENHL